MNKTELIEAVVTKTSKYTKAVVQEILDTEKTIIKETVAKGEEVKLVGFGTFEPRKQATRLIKVPNKKEKVNVDNKMAPKFRAAEEFKGMVSVLPIPVANTIIAE